MQKTILSSLLALVLCSLVGCRCKEGIYIPITGTIYDASYLHSLREKRTEEPLREVVIADEAAATKLYGSVEAAKTFEGYFPDDVEGARVLDKWWKSPLKSFQSDKEIITIVRHGLRRTTQNKWKVLRWFCQYFGRPRSFRSKYSLEAFDLMYYASFSADKQIRHCAVYFGISGGSRCPKIRKRFVQLSMDFFEEVERTVNIAKGSHDLRDEMVGYLQPYLNSLDTKVRQRAVLMKKFFTGELDYYKWRKEHESVPEQANPKAQKQE